MTINLAILLMTIQETGSTGFYSEKLCQAKETPQIFLISLFKQVLGSRKKIPACFSDKFAKVILPQPFPPFHSCVRCFALWVTSKQRSLGMLYPCSRLAPIIITWDRLCPGLPSDLYAFLGGGAREKYFTIYFKIKLCLNKNLKKRFREKICLLVRSPDVAAQFHCSQKCFVLFLAGCIDQCSCSSAK